jgi:large subunit ribosomal protein L13
MSMKFKTWTPKAEDLASDGDWYVIDGTGLTLGRLAVGVARLLRGKHKPTWTPHQNMGDHVIVVNSDKIVVTGAKADGKVYTRYTGYPGGLKERTLRKQRELDTTVPLTHAVRGMLQHNSLGADQLKRLRVYAGAEHHHQAQQPKAATFDEKGELKIG